MYLWKRNAFNLCAFTTHKKRRIKINDVMYIYIYIYIYILFVEHVTPPRDTGKPGVSVLATNTATTQSRTNMFINLALTSHSWGDTTNPDSNTSIELLYHDAYFPPDHDTYNDTVVHLKLSYTSYPGSYPITPGPLPSPPHDDDVWLNSQR